MTNLASLEMNDAGPPLPIANPDLFGHAAAEAEFIDSFNTGRLPHAWLISGPLGIGKATLAFRIARFMLTRDNLLANTASLFGENIKNLHVEKAIFKIADQKFNFHKKNICIKIDVEGHEIYVIEGIKRLIKNNNVFLQIEIFNSNYNKVLKKLKSLKLRKIHQIKDDTKMDYFFKK